MVGTSKDDDDDEEEKKGAHSDDDECENGDEKFIYSLTFKNNKA